MKVSPELTPLAYEIAKQVLERKLTLSEGKQILASNGRMNINTAGDFINNFRYLMEGRRFSRTLNAFSMEYFIGNIFIDYGATKLSNALSALQQHIDYYENINKVIMHKMHEIHYKYSTTFLQTFNEQEQDAIIKEILKDKPTKRELLSELLNVRETEPEIVHYKGQAYKRNNKIVAQIKILRDFSCQICGTTIKKKDGSKYIEAAHIKAKHLKGCETLDNIILLCPNHHKEFDLGKLCISKHTKKFIELTLNGSAYNIKFIPDNIM